MSEAGEGTPKQGGITRRGFLKGAAAVAAGALGMKAAEMGIGAAKKEDPVLASVRAEVWGHSRDMNASLRERLKKQEAGLNTEQLQDFTINAASERGSVRTSFGVLPRAEGDPHRFPRVFMLEQDKAVELLPNARRTPEEVTVDWYVPGSDPVPPEKGIKGALGAETIMTFRSRLNQQVDSALPVFYFRPTLGRQSQLIGNGKQLNEGIQIPMRSLPNPVLREMVYRPNRLEPPARQSQ